MKNQIVWQNCGEINKKSTNQIAYSSPQKCKWTKSNINAEKWFNIKDQDQEEFEEIESIIANDFKSSSVPYEELQYEEQGK